MKRMKKKVVAMVTLAMFMMTLLPMAAFAADATGSAQTSVYKTVKANPTVEVGETVETEFEINGKDGKPVANDDYLDNVVVWATDAQGRVTDALEAYTEADTVFGTNIAGEAKQVKDDAKYVIKFARAGEYTIHAGVGADVDKAKDNELLYIADNQKVTVTAPDAGDVDGATVTGDGVNVTGSAPDFAVTEQLVADGHKSMTLKVNATIKSAAAANEKFTVSTFNGLNAVAKDENGIAYEAGTAETDRNGNFWVTLTADREGVFKLYLTAEDGYKVTVNVKTTNAEDTYPATIVTTKDDAQLLNVADLNAKKQTVYFNDAVQFEVTDNKGDVTTNIAGQPAVNGDQDYITVEAPDKFKGNKANFKLAVNAAKDNAVTISYNNTNQDLVEGTYTVTVALAKTGSEAKATFKVGKFNEKAIKDLVVKPAKDTVEVKTTALAYDVVLVDENGIEKNIDSEIGGDLMVGVQAAPVVKATIDGTNLLFGYQISGDVTKEDIVGNKVTITAVRNASDFSDIATAEVTIVDKAVAEKIAFDSEEGVAKKQNTVKATVVDSNGNVLKAVDNAKVKAYVVSQSNPDANVELDFDKATKKGAANLKIYSDKETSVDVLVAIKYDGSIYAGTLTYTIGKGDIPANTSVVMTLGSTEMLVNNNIVDMKDATPFAQDNRTYVPFRALGEALGATVDYDKDAKTVTYKLGSTEIVMTLDSKTYTVNGAEKTMDVAPFAKDNRTYVPVRFVGEGLGFTVTGLQNGAGQYVGVAFTK